MQQTVSVEKTTLVFSASVIKALNVLKKGVNRSGYVPILHNIHIALRDGRLSLTTSDLELAVRYECEADYIGNDFATTVPMAALTDALKGAKSVQIEFDPTDFEKVTLHADGATRTLPTLPAEEYPALPEAFGEGTAVLRFDLAALAQSLGTVLKFASPEEARGALLMATFIEPNGGITATDGYTMRHQEIPVTNLSDDAKPVVAPQSLASALSVIRLDKGERVEATIYSNGKWAQVRAGSWTLAVRTVDGQYPAWRSACPSFDLANVPFVRIDRKIFLAAAKQALKTLAAHRTRLLRLEANGAICRIFAESDDSGRFETTLPCETSKTIDGTNFNAKYLCRVLESFEGEKVTLMIESPIACARIFGVTDDAQTDFALQMAVRQ